MSASPENAGPQTLQRKLIVTPRPGGFGAAITGVDLAHMTQGEADAVHQAYLDHQVIVIRDQDLTPDQLVEFSARFGPIGEQENNKFAHPENDRVVILSNEIRPDGTAIGVVDAGDAWHSDSSHHEIPETATILQSIRNTKTGGDTDFCDMYAAYESLPDATKRRIEGRFGVHHVAKTLNPRVVVSTNRPGAKEYYEMQERTRPKVLQPLVRTHEETGRQALFASPRFTITIDGMDDAEAQPLLDELFATIENPAHQYRHKYQDRDVVVWDNRCIVHRATGGYALPDIRRMHRTTVLGKVRPFYRPN
ncbi:MAG TPA: TauD/TfdA family dioxygenase [Stellaceae bacterium]|jgi:taurine dioxygenase|nr:TauD/TfdA family dioxygenase [Stellaceae bacterium]